jgi:SAM-dependent methyltransferase
MARETARANGFALQLFDLQPGDRVLEVGFGHGATVARIAARVGEGFVAGVDPSSAMCAAASRLNREAIAAGHVALRRGRAEDLPYAEGSFDKALSVHTLYFWPELERALAELRRILRPGGRLLLGYRTDSRAPGSFPASVYRFRSESQVMEALRATGFADLRTYQREDGGSVVSCSVALRPDAASERPAVPFAARQAE